jgi:hypothetical protein
MAFREGNPRLKPAATKQTEPICSAPAALRFAILLMQNEPNPSLHCPSPLVVATLEDQPRKTN